MPKQKQTTDLAVAKFLATARDLMENPKLENELEIEVQDACQLFYHRLFRFLDLNTTLVFNCFPVKPIYSMKSYDEYQEYIEYLCYLEAEGKISLVDLL